LTLTFQLIRAKDQTRLPCEFGANPFSGSCHPLSNASPKNRTRFDDFAHLAHKWSANITVNSGVGRPKFANFLHDEDRTSALLTRPSAFPYCYPLWNASLKMKACRRFWPISRLKLVAMATSLDRSGNQYQIEHLHQHVYHPENLVVIDLVVSLISLLQAIVKK